MVRKTHETGSVYHQRPILHVVIHDAQNQPKLFGMGNITGDDIDYIRDTELAVDAEKCISWC